MKDFKSRIDTTDPAYYTVADGDGQTTATCEADLHVGGDTRSASKCCASVLHATESDPRPARLPNWKTNPQARDAVYRNRRRIRGARGLRLLRLRGERLERRFAHLEIV